MNFKKIIAVLAVFVMIAVPVTVVAESDGATNVEKVSLQGLIDNPSTDYWLSVEAVRDGPTTYNLIYNEGKKDCIIDCDVTDDNLTFIFKMGDSNVFKIPAKSSIIVSTKKVVNFEVDDEGTLEVCGTFNAKHGNESGFGDEQSLCVLYMGDGAVLKVNGGIVSLNPVVNKDSDQGGKDCFIYLDGITSPVSSNGCLTITSSFKSESVTYNTMKISGIAEGVTLTSVITVQYGDMYTTTKPHFIFDGFEPSNTELFFGDAKIVLESDFSTGSDVKYTIHDPAFEYVQDNFTAEVGKTFTLMVPFTVEDSGEITTDYFFGIIGENGIEKKGAILLFFGGMGITGIDTGNETNMILLEAGVAFDLTSIGVTCSDGYKFDGWYYINAFGQECKILDPANFVPTVNMDLYAKATYVGEGGSITPSGGNSNIDMGAIAILGVFLVVVIGLFAVVLVKRQ